MKILMLIKYFLRAKKCETQKDYNKALLNYLKFVQCDLVPNKKMFDYNKIVEKLTDKIIEYKKVTLSQIDVSNLSPKILILNTEIYDSGGHTEVALRYIKSFKDEYKIDFYLTSIFGSLLEETAPLKSKNIKDLVNNFHISSSEVGLDNKIIEAYNYIIENQITTINVNINMQDVVGSAVLYLIKKHTNISIIFWNHADHFYCLGTNYADKIISRVHNGKALAPYLSQYTNVIQLPFLMDNSKKEYPKSFFEDKRSELNIPTNAPITMTGCALYKVGDSYFKMMKKILDLDPNIYHIFICTLPEGKKCEIIKKYKLDEKRFIVIDTQADFDFYIQLADLYVDSFPQGSALTLVDFIKYSKPVVIMKNEKNPINSFETYLYKDYEYVCTTPEQMIDKVIDLANNKEKYDKIALEVNEHYNKAYKTENARNGLRELVR